MSDLPPNGTPQEMAMFRAEILTDEGRRLLDQGRLDQAEARFREAAATAPLAAARNNWALIRHLQDDHAGTLDVLQPLLALPDPLPFTRALASLALSNLGRQDEARTLLQQAVRDFERGLANPGVRSGASDIAWVEYTILIKQAAGALGHHRLVLDLHNRWPGRNLAAGAYAAGVAAFNLGRYEQAARIWDRITARDWERLMQAYAMVARLVEAGVVPPFALDYDTNAGGQPDANATLEQIEELSALGSVRMRFLGVAFTPEAPDPGPTLGSLIVHSGDWGLELGRRLLGANRVPMPLKIAAAQALVERGVYRLDEPIPIMHEGRETAVQLQRVEVRDSDPEGERVNLEAMRLRDAGRPDEALALLQSLQEKGIFFPPAAVTQANILRQKGDLDAARTLLEMVERLAPDQWPVLFNLAGLWLQRGDLDKARDYAERIRPGDMPPQLRGRLKELRAALAEAALVQAGGGLPDPQQLGDRYREEEEERPVSPRLRLRRALRDMPVQWLNAAAAICGAAPARRRPEREQHVAAALQDPDRLRRVVAGLPPESRAALQTVLAEGGWCKQQRLTRRFGKQDGDGFWWDEVPPQSPIGRLRAAALLVVGRTQVDGRMYKVAVVPEELRAPLAALLAGAPGGEPT